MISWFLACREPPPPPGSNAADCALPLASGGLDEDCNGTAAATVPLASARRLEIVGDHSAQLGMSVACSATPVGAFPTAIAAGGPEMDDENGDAGWAVVVDGGRTGSISVEDADLVIRGSVDDSDELGFRVVFPGDVDGDGDGEFLATGLTAYRPDALTGAAFLFDADAPGWLVSDDARARFAGGEVQAMLGGATPAGDLDGDGRAEIVLGYTYMNLFDVPGYVAIHRGRDFRGEISPSEATRVDAVDPFQATGQVMLVADIDGDDDPDLLEGELNWMGAPSPGRVTAVMGPLVGATQALDTVVRGASAGWGMGWRLAHGDLNGDGAVDLVIAAFDDGSGRRDGIAYGFLDLSNEAEYDPTDAWFTVRGETEDSALGSITVLDHDGDGSDDLAVAASSDLTTGPARPGLIYVFAGPLSPGPLDPATDAAVVYEDDLLLTALGYAIDGCDLDGDGDDELVVGAKEASWPDLPRAGRVQVIDGGPWRSP